MTVSSPRGGTREVLGLAWPAVVNMLSLTLMGTADTYFVGRIGTAEQGAVGFCGTLIWAVFCFFVGTLEIVQTFVAQHIGAGHHRRAARWATAGNHLAIAFSILPLPFAFTGSRPFEALGIAPELIPFAVVYFRIRIFGTVFFLLSRIGDGYYRGTGDTITPMIVTIVANAVNIVLDPLLIFGWKPAGIPAMGVAGAAWATVFATALHAGIYVGIARRRHRAGKDAPRYRERSSLADHRELLRVGAPSGFHWLLELTAWTAFTLAVARLDAVQAAANIIGITIIRASFMPGYGISTAAQTLVGQYLGARDVASAVRSGWTSTWITVFYMGAIGVLLYVFRREAVGLFTSDPAVIEVGARLMIWAALFQVGDGIQVALAGALRGAGDTKYVMYASLAASWFVFAPVTFYLMITRGMGAEAGWFSVNLWVLVLAVFLVARFRGRAWTKSGLALEPRPIPETEVT
jgi:MATE family multidrug resistance protein